MKKNYVSVLFFFLLFGCSGQWTSVKTESPMTLSLFFPYQPAPVPGNNLSASRLLTADVVAIQADLWLDDSLVDSQDGTISFTSGNLATGTVSFLNVPLDQTLTLEIKSYNSGGTLLSTGKKVFIPSNSELVEIYMIPETSQNFTFGVPFSFTSANHYSVKGISPQTTTYTLEHSFNFTLSTGDYMVYIQDGVSGEVLLTTDIATIPGKILPVKAGQKIVVTTIKLTSTTNTDEINFTIP